MERTRDGIEGNSSHGADAPANRNCPLQGSRFGGHTHYSKRRANYVFVILSSERTPVRLPANCRVYLEKPTF